MRRSPKSEMTPDEAAAWWIVRLDSSYVGPGERRSFEAWRRALPEHTEAFRKAEVLMNISKYVSADPAIVQMRQAALAMPKLKYRSGLRIRGIGAIAASLLIVVIGTNIFLRSQWTLSEFVTAMRNLLHPGTSEFTRFATGVGDRLTVTLVDGSNVVLDTDSEVRVQVNSVGRRIKLTRGQAMFEVAHDESRPFTVQAGDHRVLATGTAFDVRVLHAGIDVTLLHGRVVVDQADTPENNNANGSKNYGYRVELNPGERLVAAQGTPVSVSTVDVDRITSWRSGQLVFLDTRLEDAINEVNRYTATPIILEDAGTANLKINGVFRTGAALDFAQAVAGIYALSVEPTTSVIQLRRQN